MPYAIIFEDAPGSAEKRLQYRDAHLDYMRSQLPKVLASGGLLDDSGTVGEGGVIIMDFDTRAEAEAFVAADPFNVEGIYGSYQIRRWRKAFFDGQDCL